MPNDENVVSIKSSHKECVMEHLRRLNKKHWRRSATVFVCILWAMFGGWILAQRPQEPQRAQYQANPDQGTIDAIQNLKIASLENEAMAQSTSIIQLQADRNWLMGGLAMVGGLLVIVQILQMVQIRKKAP